MATLSNKSNNQQIILHSYHTIGRGNGVDTTIALPTVSMLHASIRWLNHQWAITNHGRNGTWVNRSYLSQGESLKLQSGDQLRFANDEQSIWIFEFGKPPITALVAFPNADKSIELIDFHGLPDDENPVANVYLSTEGQWIYEHDEQSRQLNDKDIVSYGDQQWQFHNPQDITQTSYVSKPEHIDSVNSKALILVSRDEERIAIELLINGERFDLSQRSHHYLLLLLSQQKIADAEKGLPTEAQGWLSLDKLPDLMGVDRNHINILIFRAKKQYSKTIGSVFNGLQVLQRELGSIRVTWDEIEITQGDNTRCLTSG